ncbi:MAG: hypothetical protein ACLPN6_23450 [Streptosporangiaceae bacterium]|jgi:FtsH-binding integral membrane protein|nr:hypothetical protein [Actinomycetota bacterium]
MTPWAGFVTAIVAGWLVRDPRRAVATVIVPFLVVLATQSWMIAAGRAVSPPGTVTRFPQSLSYWIVQAIFLALAFGIAAELSSLRRARMLADDGTGTGRAAPPAHVASASVLLALLTVVFEVGYLLDSSPVRDHSGNGAPPVQGLAGILLCAGSFAVLSVLTIRARRDIAGRNGAGAAAAPGRT